MRIVGRELDYVAMSDFKDLTSFQLNEMVGIHYPAMIANSYHVTQKWRPWIMNDIFAKFMRRHIGRSIYSISVLRLEEEEKILGVEDKKIPPTGKTQKISSDW